MAQSAASTMGRSLAGGFARLFAFAAVAGTVLNSDLSGVGTVCGIFANAL